MVRPRGLSNTSSVSSVPDQDQVCTSSPPGFGTRLDFVLTLCQELGSMYDYLAKVVLLGPSGAGKYVTDLML